MKKIFKELPPPIDSSFLVKQEITTQFANPFHYHDGYELTFILQGRGKFYGGNQVMNFAEGDVYFLGPMFPHYFVNEKPSSLDEPMAHSISVQFQHNFLGKELLEKPEFCDIGKLLRLVQSSGLKITTPNKVSERLYYELTEPGITKVLLLLRMLDRLAILPDKNLQVIALHYYDNTDSYKDFSKLDPVYHYVLENFKEDVNSRKAASLAFLNEAAFCRYFKRQTKKTFSQFVNQVRTTHATSLLQDKNKSIADVCYECGFNNLSYFNRQFKNLTNRSPLEYRKQYEQS
ncbi:MAG: helix-turn-helix-domain containing protein AraC type [Ferruginibacter sp.]|uniref:AraC family transcriptional regulator n=1 Tax=Ferruginibacter sp. TaxID=1940288 RepID=UPI00265A03CE|nr:AraC family transcriptional regulator [Ferruginibacter sp.]MDB5279619.1 helix-turn-helix-domain containing protein AraC type [Ferruginibacter sp.]